MIEVDTQKHDQAWLQQKLGYFRTLRVTKVAERAVTLALDTPDFIGNRLNIESAVRGFVMGAWFLHGDTADKVAADALQLFDERTGYVAIDPVQHLRDNGQIQLLQSESQRL